MRLLFLKLGGYGNMDAIYLHVILVCQKLI